MLIEQLRSASNVKDAASISASSLISRRFLSRREEESPIERCTRKNPLGVFFVGCALSFVLRARRCCSMHSIVRSRGYRVASENTMIISDQLI